MYTDLTHVYLLLHVYDVHCVSDLPLYDFKVANHTDWIHQLTYLQLNRSYQYS